jgi:hypothetical protein
MSKGTSQIVAGGEIRRRMDREFPTGALYLRKP